MRFLKGLNGTTYTLPDKPAHVGGEAEVFDVNGKPDLTAKIYKPNILSNTARVVEHERKLKALLRMNLPCVLDGRLCFTWPQDILYENGKMVGFTMPKIKDPVEFFDAQRFDPTAPNNLSTKKILSVYPKFNWQYSAQIAYLLSYLIAYLHSRNIVVGDMNQKNILIDSKHGHVILIDCDSFQFKDPTTGEMFYCEVGMPEIQAPELQGGGSFKGRFNKYTDNFSLNIHIFRLLMKNANPFGGIGGTGASKTALNQGDVNILEGNCPYVRTCALKIPQNMPDYKMLPPEFRDLFNKTFNYTAATARSRITQRATAAEWMKVLQPYCVSNSPKIRHCSKSTMHVYPGHNARCPWCALEHRLPAARPKPRPAAGRNTTTGQTGRPNPRIQTGTAGGKKYTPARPQKRPGTTGHTALPKNSSVVRRSPVLFYAVLILCGISSVYVLGALGLLDTVGSPSVDLSSWLSSLPFMLTGGIAAGLVAYWLEDKYITAYNSIPWLMLGLLFLILTPLATALVFKILELVGAVLAVVFEIIVGIVVIAMLFACCCG